MNTCKIVEPSEQRSYSRYPCHLPVKITTKSGECDGVAVSISLGGMLVEKTEFFVDYIVKLRFRIPTMTSDIETSAYTCWYDENAVGMRFGTLLADEVLGLNQFFDEINERHQPEGLPK
ncbi:putative PilZ domain-containing protein [Gammaproteobacteria bacterium]